MVDDNEILLKELEKAITAIYETAEKELQQTIDEYFSKFKKKDKIKREQLKKGIITEKEYRDWRIGQILVGKRWIAMRHRIAVDIHEANVIARRIIDDVIPEAYVSGMNYHTYYIEHGIGVDTDFTLYNREAVEHILRRKPQMLPKPGKAIQAKIKAGRDILWNEQTIQSVAMQGILQGKSIPDIATDLGQAVGDDNRKSAIRNARTVMTNAENLGAVDAMKRAKSKGISLKKTWVAALDFRTRHTHRLLDGQTVDVDKPFQGDGFEISYPGDMSAPPKEIYNCRCTIISQIRGFERDLSDLSIRRSEKLDGMSYADWKESKRVESHSITKQDTIAEIMKKKYIADYRRR